MEGYRAVPLFHEQSSYGSLCAPPSLAAAISRRAKQTQLPKNHQGRRYSYSGRGAQTGVVVGTNSGSAAQDGSSSNGHAGHFEASTELASEVSKVVSQLDQLKEKINKERKVALEKKRSRRPGE